MSWWRITETLLGVSFETCLRRRWDVLMRHCCYVLLRCRRDVPITRGDVPLRRLGGIPTRRRWVFHLGHTCDVAGTYRQTSLRRRHDVLLPGGLFIRCKKLNISLVFITQSYFSVPKDVRLNSTHYLIMKISNRKELKNITINYSADIDYNDFLRICKECTRKPYSFLKIDTTLRASDPLRFRKNFASVL